MEAEEFDEDAAEFNEDAAAAWYAAAAAEDDAEDPEEDVGAPEGAAPVAVVEDDGAPEPLDSDPYLAGADEGEVIVADDPYGAPSVSTHAVETANGLQASQGTAAAEPPRKVQKTQAQAQMRPPPTAAPTEPESCPETPAAPTKDTESPAVTVVAVVEPAGADAAECGEAAEALPVESEGAIDDGTVVVELDDSSWDESVLVVRQGQVHIEIQGRSPPMHDSTLQRFCDWLDQQLPNVVRDYPYVKRSGAYVDLSDNVIGPEGLDKLFRVLREHQVPCVVMKAYRNVLDDSIVDTLIEYLYTQPEAFPMHGIHISHNNITDKGAFRLIRAAAQCGHYPRYTSRLPLWLRLECNDISSPQKIVADANVDGFNVCLMGNGLCSRRDCNHYSGVHVQLPYFFHQGRSGQAPPAPLYKPPPMMPPPRQEPKAPPVPPLDDKSEAMEEEEEEEEEGGAQVVEESAADREGGSGKARVAGRPRPPALDSMPDWMRVAAASEARPTSTQGILAPKSSQGILAPRRAAPAPRRGAAAVAAPKSEAVPLGDLPSPLFEEDPFSGPFAMQRVVRPGRRLDPIQPMQPPPGMRGRGRGGGGSWSGYGRSGGGGWRGAMPAGDPFASFGGGGPPSRGRQMWQGLTLDQKVKKDVKLGEGDAALGFQWTAVGEGRSPRVTSVEPGSTVGTVAHEGDSLLRVNGLDTSMFSEKQIADMLKQRPISLRFGDE